jgi:RNA recognition motif-containing protein
LKSLLGSLVGKVITRDPVINKKLGKKPKDDVSEDEDEEEDIEESEEEDSDDSASDAESNAERYNHFKKTKPVQKDIDEQEEVEQPKYEKHFEIFIDNLPTKKSEEEIKEFFADIDENMKVKLLNKFGKFTGKGFLKFYTKQDAEKFLKENRKLRMDSLRLNMRMVNVNDGTINLNSTVNGGNFQSTNQQASNSFYTAFLGNLPPSVTEEKLKKHFKGVSKIRLMITKEGKAKSFGYVDFKTEEDLNKAIEKQVTMDGKEVKIEKAKTSFNTQVMKDSKRLKKKRHRDENNF